MNVDWRGERGREVQRAEGQLSTSLGQDCASGSWWAGSSHLSLGNLAPQCNLICLIRKTGTSQCTYFLSLVVSQGLLPILTTFRELMYHLCWGQRIVSMVCWWFYIRFAKTFQSTCYCSLYIGTLEEANEQQSLKVQSETMGLFKLCMWSWKRGLSARLVRDPRIRSWIFNLIVSLVTGFQLNLPDKVFC